MRRDSQNNLYIYSNEGNIDAFVPANTVSKNARTDGNLVVKYLGNGLGDKFVGNVARFGVIERDIGTVAASKLAVDLAKKYTPTS